MSCSRKFFDEKLKDELNFETFSRNKNLKKFFFSLEFFIERL